MATTTRTTTTTERLSDDDKFRFAQGYKVITSSTPSDGKDVDDEHAFLTDLVHLCFHNDATKLPALEAYYHGEFQSNHNSTVSTNSSAQTKKAFFDTMVQQYQDYVKIHGRAQVREDAASSNHPDTRTLAWWITWQKHLMNMNKLSTAHQRALTKVNFDFRSSENGDDWDTNMYGWDTRRAT